MHLLVFVYSSLQIQFDKYIIQCLKVINCELFFYIFANLDNDYYKIKRFSSSKFQWECVFGILSQHDLKKDVNINLCW